MKFRPCIDLFNGKVVQIVGGSLQDNDDNVEINHASEMGPAEFAGIYQDDGLTGGHVISLGKGNKEAALAALGAFPGGMQYGGGVNPENAIDFLEAGASHVIVTSYVFSDGLINMDRLEDLVYKVGRDRLVLDLSCRSKAGKFHVVTDRWQNFTDEVVNQQLLEKLSIYCAEFLVHGVDVEGMRQGIQEDLIEILGAYSPLPVTYAGGVNRLEDLELVRALGQDRVDLTIGSALDLFGGDVAYQDVLQWCQENQGQSGS